MSYWNEQLTYIIDTTIEFLPWASIVIILLCLFLGFLFNRGNDK